MGETGKGKEVQGLRYTEVLKKRVYSTVKGNQPYCWLPQKPRVYKGSEAFVTKVTKKYINLLFLNRLIYKCIISVNLSYWLHSYTFLSSGQGTASVWWHLRRYYNCGAKRPLILHFAFIMNWLRHELTCGHELPAA